MIRFVAQALTTLVFSLGWLALVGLPYLFVAASVGVSCGLILLGAKRESVSAYGKALLAAIFLGVFWPSLPLIIIWGDLAKRVEPSREVTRPDAFD